MESPVENPEQAVADDEESLKLRDAVEGAVRVLDERERYIVDHRLMADREEEALARRDRAPTRCIARAGSAARDEDAR